MSSSVHFLLIMYLQPGDISENNFEKSISVVFQKNCGETHVFISSGQIKCFHLFMLLSSDHET